MDVRNGEMGVLLINPGWTRLDEPFEHLGLGYLAACLRAAGVDTEILDVPLIGKNGENTVFTRIKEGGIGLVGVSITFQEGAKDALAFIVRLKSETGIPVAVGGIYPTLAYKEIMELYPAVDFVVKGEGEVTFTELARAVLAGTDVQGVNGIVYRQAAEIVETADRPSVTDLDTLPLPARDTLAAVVKTTGYASLLSSRGCYGRCTFCSVDAFYSPFGAKYRMRSAENVLSEIEKLIYEFGVKNLAFNDANFIGGTGRGSERAREIAERILERGWKIRFSIQCRANDVDRELFSLLKQAGLCKVFLGVESGSQSVLDRFQKDITVAQNLEALKVLSELGIYVAMGFIMFDSQTSFSELGENSQFLQSVKEVTGQAYLANVDPVSKVLPFAGTKVEEELKKKNRYRGNTLNFSYNLEDPAVEFVYRGIRLAMGGVRRIKAVRGESQYREFDWNTVQSGD